MLDDVHVHGEVGELRRVRLGGHPVGRCQRVGLVPLGPALLGNALIPGPRVVLAVEIDDAGVLVLVHLHIGHRPVVQELGLPALQRLGSVQVVAHRLRHAVLGRECQQQLGVEGGKADVKAVEELHPHQILVAPSPDIYPLGLGSPQLHALKDGLVLLVLAVRLEHYPALVRKHQPLVRKAILHRIAHVVGFFRGLLLQLGWQILVNGTLLHQHARLLILAEAEDEAFVVLHRRLDHSPSPIRRLPASVRTQQEECPVLMEHLLRYAPMVEHPSIPVRVLAGVGYGFMVDVP